MSRFSGFFRPDNSLWRTVSAVADMMGLSLLWLLCSLPVVTIGPATAALYAAVRGPVRRMENGQVTDKPALSITAGTMTEQMAAQYQLSTKKGVFVYSVNKGGAGDNAGLQMGDVITKLGDAEITSMEELSAAKKNYKAGDTVTVTFWRGDEEKTTQLTFDVQSQNTGSDSSQSQTQEDSNSYSSGDLYNYFFGRR